MEIAPEKILMVSGIGQASPTSRHGFITKAQPRGVACHASNPLALALSQGAGFVARGYCKEIAHLSQLIREGISYPGFRLIDILQVCVSFNKENTYTFYKDRVYTLDKEEYKADDLHQALDSESICLPLFRFHGIFFAGT